MIVVIMGVSGSGKTTIGRLLARRLGWPFYDGDDFHPIENIRKMSQGIPLTDVDRDSWLDALASLLRNTLERGGSAVLACSALKRAYRERLRVDPQRVRFVYLKGDYAIIRQRLQERSGHFMDPDLLVSQFETLEEPSQSLTVDIYPLPERIVDEIIRELSLA
ncbi:MAG TPA: gluconokinase [Anaerolineaceae bacterium]|nr:gluconokinase [Anaerolineaceae bacterium]